MDRLRIGPLRSTTGHARWILIALIGLLLATAATASKDEPPTLSDDDQACLKCHDKPGFDVRLANGERLPLYVSAKAYLASVHNTTNCEDCHDDIDAKTHGKDPSAIKSKRDQTFKMQESCNTCHKKKVKQYDDSLHAAMVKAGAHDAPLCADCHDPHTQASVKIVAPLERTPCARCHDAIFEAYAGDVHGTKRRTDGKPAPICADCHRAHDIQAASLGDGIRDSCLGCHENTLAEHKVWLPNAQRHFDAISCPTCHAPDAKRRVNLRLYDAAAGRQLAEKSGVPQFVRRAQAADLHNVGLDERALWSLLKEFNQDDGAGRTVLRGRLEVSSGVDAHRMTDKSSALRDCTICHQAGAEPFQSVVLTIASADGRPLRHGVQSEVLRSATAIESVRGFYAIGSTRIHLLDTLLLMVVVGAAAVPLGHMAVRRWFKSERDRRRLAEAEQLLQREGQAPPPPQ